MFCSWGQNDTLRESNMRKVADTLFANLDQDIYGESLLNRSFSTNEVIKQQVKGVFNQTFSVIDFLNMYSDVALSYVDSTYMMTNREAANTIDSIFRTNELSNTEDELIQPFGLLYHFSSFIDSATFTTDNFSAQNHSYVSLISEDHLYDEVLIKSGALLEFYPESGYTEGKLQYVSELISHSPDIKNLTLRLDVGNGFVDFSESNSLISYDRTQDSLVGFVEVSYEKGNSFFTDTLSFYLTTKGESSRQEKWELSSGKWDDVGYYYPQTPQGVGFIYGKKVGCGNDIDKLKRPIIIVPPYRPSIQPFSLNKYYEQFDFKSLIFSLSEMGYDVLFIKQMPGNVSLEKAGGVLADFIKEVNWQKAQDYPHQSWENIVIGFSMGGQIARYALKELEYEHMIEGSYSYHHHTRLYIPYDSPHLGANIPMFAQFVYKDLKNSSIFAHLAYNSLVDEASKDMSVSHVIGSLPTITSAGNMEVLSYDPTPTSERTQFIDALNNDFNHQFTPLNDLRRSYPTFTRNVAVSTGRNNQNYTEEFQLDAGQLLFSQNALTVGLGGILYKNRKLYASKYSVDQSVFRNQVKLNTLLIPITLKDRDYRTNNALEWDMAQGGYKDEFYDAPPISLLPFIATGAVPILRLNANLWGQKFYSDHMNFLPLVSALGINPNIWQNNNLFFDMRNEGLMFENYLDLNNNIRSELFGYPHLGHPSNHFNITPFEAVYADPQTYEHIKMAETIEDDENNLLSDVYLVHTRDFILNEVESDVVALQNKVIGKNHNQGISNYKYSAWYKAYDRIEIGHQVTPKTNPGDYIIESTGDITVYAQNSVHIKPGFHAQSGSDFHAYIAYDGCSRPREGGKSATVKNNSEKGSTTTTIRKDVMESEKTSLTDILIYPNPNNGSCVVKIPAAQLGGSYAILNTNGVILRSGVFREQTEQRFDLPKGVYYFQWRRGKQYIVKKIIVI